MPRLFKAVLAAALFFALPAFAMITEDEAYRIASEVLGTDNAELDQESDRTYFFIDAAFDEDAEHPCLNGVLIDRATGNVVTPDEQNDPRIRWAFEYSDTSVDPVTKIVKNCAD